MPCGIVRVIDLDNGLYEGQFENGDYNGFGRYIHKYGQYYVGWFQNGKMHGYGKYVQGDGRISEGNWNNGTFCEILDFNDID